MWRAMVTHLQFSASTSEAATLNTNASLKKLAPASIALVRKKNYAQ